MTATTPAGAPAPREMEAAVLRDFGELTVERVPVPAVGPGEALCRVRACGICGTDLKIVGGEFRGVWPPSLPFIIGHEWSGVVAALGPGAERSGLEVGDRVVAENHAGCGSCPLCRVGRYNLCERVREPGYRLYGHTAQGALAEYAVRPAVLLHKLPPTIGDVESALVNQGALTVHAVRRARGHACASPLSWAATRSSTTSAMNRLRRCARPQPAAASTASSSAPGTRPRSRRRSPACAAAARSRCSASPGERAWSCRRIG